MILCPNFTSEVVTTLPIDEQDFTAIRELEGFVRFDPGLPGETPRRQCFDVSITNDGLYENVESFTLILFLDTFGIVQSGVIVQPNVTKIFIVDEDGKSLFLCVIIKIIIFFT